MLILEGNDASGKTTLAQSLRLLGIPVQDRGRITLWTDDPTVTTDPEDQYVLLDLPWETCYKRILARNGGEPDKDPYHQPATLQHYAGRFRESISVFNPLVLDGCNTVGDNLDTVVKWIMGRRLKIGLAKGRLAPHATSLPYPLNMSLPKGHPAVPQGQGFHLVQLRAREYVQMVSWGALDVALVGSDILDNSPLKGNVRVIHRLPQQGVRVVVMGTGHTLPTDRPLRVATSFPEWASAHFGSRGVPHLCYFVEGGAEVFVAQGLADVALDIVETGETMRGLGLVELEDLGTLDLCVICKA